MSKKRLNTAFITDKGEFGYFGGGIIKLVSSDEAEAIKTRLGPDMLTVKTSLDAFARAQTTDPPIGEALLSQELVSGIGNVYKSESMFIAKIHPLRWASAVSAREYERLFNWLQPQMVKDIKRPGKMITTTREAAKAVHWNFVYRRYHQNCLLCNTKIERIYQGAGKGRSTYYCPHCQPNTSLVQDLRNNLHRSSQPNAKM
ncbi:hypothetical protein HJC99_02685 [Candidatus Saccharibacteria bacterium]|nr:hypothetical protein [Candidatus Saccharibacteria bacterium]